MIKYETIKNGYITKEQAIAIAGSDRCLKDSIFKKWKQEKNIVLGWISFSSFDVALVQLNYDFAWHIKVKTGEWGGIEKFNMPIIKHLKMTHWDGDFGEEDNISCIVMCNSGQYYFGDDIDITNLREPNMEQYNVYIKSDSIYH